MIKIAFDPSFIHPLPPDHRFPMLKYELIPEQLLYEGSIRPDYLFSPAACEEETILLTHQQAYYEKLVNQTLSAAEQRKIGFPQSIDLTKRERLITQGTLDCSLFALKYGIALNVAGGTHHAFADRGEGFCLLNDVAVASNFLLAKEIVSRILIIDLDVHQGNGSASLFAAENRVFTFSMHGEHNYPFHKEKSDLDIGLKDGTETAAYLGELQSRLPVIIEKIKPDFAFYIAGVDILETDKFGKLRVTVDGCKSRDQFVFKTLRTYQIPVAVSMGGGYSPDIRQIVNAHCNTFRAALELYD